MPDADVFPGNFVEEFRALQRRVAELEALLKARPPITAASKGWLLTNMSVPSVDAGQVHIGANGGDFYSVNASGQVKRMLAPAANVIVPGISAPNAPSSYSQSQAQAISDGLATTYNSLVALIINLRAAGILI